MLRTEASSLEKTHPAAPRTLEDRAEELQNAISAVKSKLASEGSDSGSEPVWTCGELEAYVEGRTSESWKRRVLLVEGRAIDVTSGKERVRDFFSHYFLPTVESSVADHA